MYVTHQKPGKCAKSFNTSNLCTQRSEKELSIFALTVKCHRQKRVEIYGGKCLPSLSHIFREQSKAKHALSRSCTFSKSSNYTILFENFEVKMHKKRNYRRGKSTKSTTVLTFYRSFTLRCNLKIFNEPISELWDGRDLWYFTERFMFNVRRLVIYFIWNMMKSAPPKCVSKGHTYSRLF